MNFDDWHGLYKEILHDFQYDEGADASSSDLLASLISGMDTIDPDILKNIISGNPVIVIGGALKPEDMDSLEDGAIIIAAEGAVSQLLHHDILPGIIMTDLDGDVEEQINANSCGSIAVIHAHGDNMDALRLWLPKFTGRIMGTTQNRPHGVIQNYGGFTDGDRGVFLASHFNARNIRLLGFDFDNPIPKPGKDPGVKKKKLAWAKKLISLLIDI